MASIFTYEPDPPRVSSPWLQAIDAVHDDMTDDISREDTNSLQKPSLLSSTDAPSCKITRLCAEPQDGPVEYKLHLLLRSRRHFRYISTAKHLSGSWHAQVSENHLHPLPHAEDLEGDGNALEVPTTLPTSTQQARQHRLEQLTTQLLWRLQQSSPHHTSSANNIILPTLPEALPELEAPPEPAKLLHGLEESQGALYEIGVSDDGTLVGLTDEEMQESLNNLRAMAACLGCVIEVLRRETVGHCEWAEDEDSERHGQSRTRQARLVVAEALVKPSLQLSSTVRTAHNTLLEPHLRNIMSAAPAEEKEFVAASEQLRITFAGPTMSGKSTLLGTLTTSTLDNGRGKSRLTMLKHRHEITTGVTSSVTQELLGYRDMDDGQVDVINYARENIDSWIDMHNAAAGHRLVLISDSAGHPKYRRTTIRGLVGWAPHWTFLCVSADDSDGVAARAGNVLGSPISHHTSLTDLDLSAAQLELCLRLRLPLVIVVTKLDLASRGGLRQTLTKLLDALKAAGRKPVILPNSPDVNHGEDLQNIPATVLDAAYTRSIALLNDPLATVPIVLTSAVKDTGIQTLHALLHELPLVGTDNGDAKQPSRSIFHVEEVYNRSASLQGTVVSGRLRSGQVAVGDLLVVGPFSGHDHLDDSEDSEERPMNRHARSTHLPTSRSFPGALSTQRLPLSHLPNQEWKRVRVLSIRNLRLPVPALVAGQVGTMVIAADSHHRSKVNTAEQDYEDTTLARVRKGMVLVPMQPIASRTLVADFTRSEVESLAVGNHVVVYTASVRASARVVSFRETETLLADAHADDDDPDVPFLLDDDHDRSHSHLQQPRASTTDPTSRLQVTFKFEYTKEFIIVGDRVLVMPGGGPGLFGTSERGERGLGGLDGYVGEIIEALS